MFYFQLQKELHKECSTINIVLLSNTYANTYPKVFLCSVWVNHLLDLL